MEYEELDTKKEIHIKLLAETHSALKLQSIHLKMSMTLIFNELAALVVQEDPYIMQKLKELAKRRKKKEALALLSTDADTLLNHIEEMRKAENDAS